MKVFSLIFFLLLANGLFAQNFVRGKIVDERKSPIPFAKIYVKNTADQRTVAAVDGSYELSLMPGEYFLVISALGYQDRETYISISSVDLQRDIQLFPEKEQDYKEIVVNTKKGNIGREIMLEVVKRREQMNPWNYAHSVDVYIKASEQKDIKVREQKNKKENKDEPEDATVAADPLEASLPKAPAWVDNMNLLEVQLKRNYAPGNKVKEIRNAYTLHGSDQSLYYTTTVKSNFNFFENLLHLDDLHQTPVSSPISVPGILSYKYRMEETYVENGLTICKIKIIPRNTATTTLEGYIYVIDSLFLIQKLQLTMNKGNLLIYDHFEIDQTFSIVGDTMCVLDKQVLSYGVKYKNETSACQTTALFSNYNFDPEFSKKFFNTELAVTTKEAYERDTNYWSNTRQTSLSPEEQRFIIIKDSIRDFYNRKEYLDSIDEIFNKITPLKILWFGVDHRNREQKIQWSLGSVATLIQPFGLGGPRLNPSFDYFKKWKDERSLETYTRFSYGFLNKDVKGNTWWRYRFDPFHFGFVRFSINHDFDVIRGYDAITQIYKRDNFIEATKMTLSADYELFNGFYAYSSLGFSERRSLTDFKFLNTIDNIIPNNDPTDFKPYQAMIGYLGFSYTPKQKYMREPYRKVVLGSAWPTFSVNYERGIPKLFGSDVDHEYLQVDAMQSFKISTLGTMNYRISVGKFLSARQLYNPDYKYQRRSDPIWFSNPLYSFQGLDTTLPTIDYVFQAHVVHHDNGAILNKIPYFKKTRIGLVAGAGAMYVKEYDWQHYEILGGLERNFKMSRRRLRVGIYGVISDGNQIKPTFDWKVSFAILDDRNMKWNF